MVPLQDVPGRRKLTNHPTAPASTGKSMNEIFEKISGAQTACTATAAPTVPAAFVFKSSRSLRNRYKANKGIAKPAKPILATNMAKTQLSQSSKGALPGLPLERRNTDTTSPKNASARSPARPSMTPTLSPRENASKKKIAKIIIPDARRTLVTRMAYLKLAMTEAAGDVRRQGLNILSIVALS